MHNERTSEIAFGNTTSLDPKQARQKVGPDLDLNDLQRLSAIRQKIVASKESVYLEKITV